MVFLIYPLAFLAVISLIVVVHEFGHFLIAKAFGIRVEVFSLGFGKRITGYRFGSTDYRLSAIPLGGYIRMLGEGLGTSSQNHPEAFNSHPRLQRALITLAGPFANIVFTVLLMTGIYFVQPVHTQHLDQRPMVASVTNGSLAASAGFQAGDLIEKIDDDETPTWRDVLYKIQTAGKRPVAVLVLRNGKPVAKTLQLAEIEGRQRRSVGWVPEEPNTVSDIAPDSPAERAGVEVGDQIVSVNGLEVRKLSDLLSAVKLGRSSHQVVVLRGTRKLELAMANDQFGFDDTVLGLKLQVLPVPERTISASFMKAVEFSKNNLDLIYRLIRKMLVGKVSVRQMDGPIGIMQASGAAARERGWQPLFTLIAFLSLNVAALNLFPLPILDGGTLLLLSVEGLLRRDLRQELKMRIYATAIIVLLLLFSFVIYNDISKAVKPASGSSDVRTTHLSQWKLQNLKT